MSSRHASKAIARAASVVVESLEQRRLMARVLLGGYADVANVPDMVVTSATNTPYGSNGFEPRAGVEYLLHAQGTMRIRSTPLYHADAEFTRIEDGGFDYTQGGPPTADVGIGIDGAEPAWGVTTMASNHVYERTYVGTGDAMTAKFWDTDYGDNANDGGLKVALYGPEIFVAHLRVSDSTNANNEVTNQQRLFVEANDQKQASVDIGINEDVPGDELSKAFFVWRIRKDGGAEVAHGDRRANTTVQLTADPDYNFVAESGFDDDGDGILDASELEETVNITLVYLDRIKVTESSTQQYAEATPTQHNAAFSLTIGSPKTTSELLETILPDTPAEARKYVAWRAGGPILSISTTFDNGSAPTIDLIAKSSVSTFTFEAGFDDNFNGRLDNGEATRTVTLQLTSTNPLDKFLPGLCSLLDDCGNGLVGEAVAAFGQNPAANAYTVAPVRYGEGLAKIDSNDLLSAFGDGFGHTWSWNSLGGFGTSGANGVGSNVAELPSLAQGEGGDLTVVFSGSVVRQFDESGGAYTPRFFYPDTLQHRGSFFVFTDSTGGKVYFNDFSAAHAPAAQGQFRMYENAAGVTREVLGYYPTGQPTLVWQKDPATGVQEVFTYSVGVFDAAYKIDSVSLYRTTNGSLEPSTYATWPKIRSVSYDYYLLAESGNQTIKGGSWGALKTAVIRDKDENEVETKYYRYKSVAPGFFSNTNELTYVFSGASYARLRAAMAAEEKDPFTASNSDVAPYADNYFQYDSQGRVTLEKAQGKGCSGCSASGFGTFQMAYDDSGAGTLSNLNAWKTKTVETLPDGNQNFVFTNAAGLVILKVFKETSTGKEWPEYIQYDADGRVTLTAGSDAIYYWGQSGATLTVTLKNATNTPSNPKRGVVTRISYYDTTDLPNGKVAGYEWKRTISNGADGTEVTQQKLTYTSHEGSPTQVPGDDEYFADSSITVYPIASQTVYRTEAEGGPQTTTYTYQWHVSLDITDGVTPIDTVRQKLVTATLPIVEAGQNGDGNSVQTKTAYDKYGRVSWTQDGAGYITFREYDAQTGAVLRVIVDAAVSDIPSYAATDSRHVATPTRSISTAALRIATTMEVDELGRTTKRTDPNNNVTHWVYRDHYISDGDRFFEDGEDYSHEIRVYSGWGMSNATRPPTEVLRQDYGRGYVERLTMSVAPQASGGKPTGGETIGSIQSLVRDIMNLGQQIVANDVYTSEVTYDNESVVIDGPKRLRTEVGYDKGGRQARVLRADGTVEHVFYDGLGRAISVWKGTDDATATDVNTDSVLDWRDFRTSVVVNGILPSDVTMFLIQEDTYDGDGIGAGLITSSESFHDTGSYVTDFEYDWRNRLFGERGADNVATIYTYNNLNQAIQTDVYADTDGDFNPADTSELRGHSTADFDNLGRAYQTKVHEVDPATSATPGFIRDGLATKYWYDKRGNLAKTQDASGRIDKVFYDGAGRVTRTTISADPTEASSGTYADAVDANLTNDQVIEQNDYWLDAGGRKRVSISWKRDGWESDALTGPAGTSHFDYSVVAYWYDAADRLVGTADYGRDGTEAGATSADQLVLDRAYAFKFKDSDSDGIPNVIDAAQDAVPALSNYTGPNDTSYNWIRTKYVYDAGGRVQDVIDNANRTTRTEYDLAGRTTRTIENYINGVTTASERDCDRITEYVYDDFGRLWKQVAYNANGSTVQQQTTVNLYASEIDRSWVSFTIYPDSGDSYSVNLSGVGSINSGTDHVAYVQDRMGRTKTSTDQRGVVHTYSFDSAGRLMSDAATTITSGVDGRVRRIGYTYDDLSRSQKVTSYDAVSGGNVVNEVQHVYDGWGNVTRTYQAHDGAVNTSTTPFIEYIYEDGGNNTSTGVASYVRLYQVNYPTNNGGSIGSFRPYYHGTGEQLITALNRVGQMRGANGSQLVEYRWLGVDTLVNWITHPTISGGLMMNEGAKMSAQSGDYFGFDRYYRYQTIQWQKTNGSVNFELRTYKYDRMGNRLSTDNSGSGGGGSNWDETYSYDGLNRLTTFNRGTMSGGSITGTDLKFQQTWGLDSLGNWKDFAQTSTSVAPYGVYPTFTQTRTANAANEITSTSGGDFAATDYDAAGNMTKGPKAGAETNVLRFKYDAWNRLAGMNASSDLGDTDFTDAGDYLYNYDGIGRRISKWQDTVNDSTNNAGSGEEFYYNESYQTVEVRVATTASGVKSINANPKERILWDMTYIDAPAMVELDTNTDGTKDNTLWPMWDANHNVTALLTSAGVTVERYAYTPYGQQIVINGDQNYANNGPDPDSPTEWTVDTTGSDFGFVGAGFQGLRLDSESGLIHQRGRQNHVMLGRFVQRDPLGPVDSPNLYQAVRSQPLMFADPYGLRSERFTPGSSQWEFDQDRYSEYLDLIAELENEPMDYRDAYFKAGELMWERHQWSPREYEDAYQAEKDANAVEPGFCGDIFATEKRILDLLFSRGQLGLGIEVDVVSVRGVEFGGGLMVDTRSKSLADFFWNMGIYYVGGPAVGENIGIGGAITFAPGGELAGAAAQVDANVKFVSGFAGATIEDDPKPVYGGSLGYGGGVSASVQKTGTVTVGDVYNFVKGLLD